jgi:hypothetical protein
VGFFNLYQNLCVRQRDDEESISETLPELQNEQKKVLTAPAK